MKSTILLCLCILHQFALAEGCASLILRGMTPEKSWKVYDKGPAYESPLVVRALRMSGQSLRALPLDIVKFENLEYLDISNNEISLSASDIEVLSHFPKLEVIDVSKNAITEIGVDIGKLGRLTNLTHLFLPYNKITQINSSFVEIRNLKCLVLSHNPIGTIPTFVGDLAQLEVFEASDCGLHQWTRGRFKKLKHILLNNNNLSITSLEGFPDTLTEIFLANNKIFKFSLKRCPNNLESIVLSGNNLTSLDDNKPDNVVVVLGQ